MLRTMMLLGSCPTSPPGRAVTSPQSGHLTCSWVATASKHSWHTRCWQRSALGTSGDPAGCSCRSQTSHIRKRPAKAFRAWTLSTGEAGLWGVTGGPCTGVCGALPEVVRSGLCGPSMGLEGAGAVEELRGRSRLDRDRWEFAWKPLGTSTGAGGDVKGGLLLRRRKRKSCRRRGCRSWRRRAGRRSEKPQCR